MSNEEEIWKDVPGFEGLYQVSNLGRVKSLGHWKSNCRGPGIHRTKPRILKLINSHGYRIVDLCNQGIKERKWVHDLVLEAFVSHRPEGMEACHDPDRTGSNNRLENLRWDTRSNNHEDKNKHGTMMKGDNHTNSKVTEELVVEIRQRYAEGESQASLAIEFGVAQTNIHCICARKTWRHVP